MTTNVLVHYLKDDGVFPNNRLLPVIVYKNYGNGKLSASELESLFSSNNWKGAWRNGIYDYHHYHSLSHEVLGIYSGIARVQLGGPTGIMLELKGGDILIIPAGVAHKNCGSSNSFKCIGAYPAGQEKYDIKRGYKQERPQADKNIAGVQLPENDPLYGKKEQ